MPGKVTGRGKYWRVIVLATLVMMPVAASGAAVAQTADNSTATNATSQEGCQVDGPPPLENTRVYLEDRQVEQGDPGKISLQHELDTSYNCPVVVLATIYAPSGVEVSVSGGGTVEQFEGGAQALYTIDPTTGGTVGTSSIEVHYTGEVEDEMEVEIEGTAQLFPEGYRSQSEYHTDIGGMNQPIVILESTNPESNASQDQGVIDTVDDLTLSEKKIIFMIGMVFLFVLTSMIVTKL